MSELTHMNEQGRARMVDVSEKDKTKRVAVASGKIFMNEHTLSLIQEGKMKKGDVLAVAQVAGIMGAKNCSSIIPMCHPINLTGVDIKFEFINQDNLYGVYIEATTRCTGETGVEMEAICAVSCAASTIYDMCKAVQRDMVITDIQLEEKSGGKSGHFVRGE